jgi:hypothetical protein
VAHPDPARPRRAPPPSPSHFSFPAQQLPPFSLPSLSTSPCPRLDSGERLLLSIELVVSSPLLPPLSHLPPSPARPLASTSPDARDPACRPSPRAALPAGAPLFGPSPVGAWPPELAPATPCPAPAAPPVRPLPRPRAAPLRVRPALARGRGVERGSTGPYACNPVPGARVIFKFSFKISLIHVLHRTLRRTTVHFKFRFTSALRRALRRMTIRLISV